MNEGNQAPVFGTDYLAVRFLSTVGDGSHPPGFDVVRMWLTAAPGNSGLSACVELYPWHARELARMLIEHAELVEAASHGQEGSA